MHIAYLKLAKTVKMQKYFDFPLSAKLHYGKA